MHWKTILENSLYFLALINPASKILILSSMRASYSGKEIRALCLRSTLFAAVLLLVFTTGGHFVLGTIFRVEIYSLKIAGGIVLFMIGLLAVRQGTFFEESPIRKGDDMSIVPFAAPLIAGPGTITGAISFASENGSGITLLSVGIALLVNMLFMLASGTIGKGLEKMHATGPLIRITGLIVAAVAVQMVLGGVAVWLNGAVKG